MSNLFDGLLNLIVDYNNFINIAFILLLILAAVGYIWRKAGSAYSIINRIWFLIVGGRKYHDPEIEAFYQYSSDIEKFNVNFNMAADSTGHIIKFKQWTLKYGVAVRMLSSIRGYFDIERLKIRKGSVKLILLALLLCAAFTLAAVIPAIIASQNAALLKLKPDEPWIWLSDDHATKFLKSSQRDRWKISAEQCARDDGDQRQLMTATALSADSIRSICQAFSSKKDRQYINETIASQKVFWWFSALFLFMAWVFYREGIKLGRIFDGRKMLLTKYRHYRKQHRKTV